MSKLPTIDIIGKDGVKHSAVYEDGSVRKFELMKEDYVKLIFHTNEKFAVSLGDHIETEWGTFYITQPQKPVFNTSSGGYDYDLQFDAPHYRWNNRLYKFEPNTNRNEASWSLTDNLRNHMAVFLRNLECLGFDYTVDLSSYGYESAGKNVYLAFENCYLLDALTKIAEGFDMEWWITDNVIHLGKCSVGSAVDFTIGVNVEDMGSEKSSKEYYTRLYAFGSTQNVPSDYRKNDEQMLLNGVVQKRIMMPTVDSSGNSVPPYIDVEGVESEDEVVEAIVIFDDVKPQTDNKITDLRADKREVEKSDTVESGNGAGSPVDSETETVTIYRFKDSSLTFSEKYVLAGVQLQAQFQSGALNGMTFDLAFNPDGLAEKKTVNNEEVWNTDAQWFEIVRNETYGVMLPNDTLKPSLNDKFVILGWDVRYIDEGMNLITNAEQELRNRAIEKAKEMQLDNNVYPCTMMSDYMYGLDSKGEQDPTKSKVGTFPLGQIVRLNNDNFFAGGSRLSRVIGYEYKLDLPYDKAVIYVGESCTYSSKGAQQAQINEVLDTINYRGGEYSVSGVGGSGVYVITTNDNTSPTDSNVYSALRSEKSFARKNENDNISALWTFTRGNGARRGIQTKDYSNNGANEDNLFGKGFELVERTNSLGDTRTRLEVDELFVRIKAFFSSLEIREISYLGGNYAFSSAGGKIYFVEWLDALDNILPKTAANLASVAKFRCYLYSDDGTTATINKWRIDDQAMCRTFNIDEGVHEGTSNKYYWRRVIGIGKSVIPSNVITDGEATEYQYVDISNMTATDYDVASDIPEEEDTIVQMGNWSEESRQGLIIIKVEGEDSPAIIEYSGVGANGRHFVLPEPTLYLSPKRNIIYGEFHSVVNSSSGSEGTGQTIDDQLRALLDSLNDIKQQADKKFDIWFGNGVPLPNVSQPSATANYPASEWTTEELKALHAQDLFYDQDKEPANTGGRAWRWIAYDDNGQVSYYWQEVTDADTIAALEQISDVASDGKLTGGAEKTRVLIDWRKAVEDWNKYMERAEDYEITLEKGELNDAFKALGKLLNGGNDIVIGEGGVVETPLWLTDLDTTTVIPSPEDYRNAWNRFYTALTVLLQVITKKAKELADAAQNDATQALSLIGDMGSDSKLDPSEKLTVKREFVASYHEMMDTNEEGYTSGILDMASDGKGGYIINYTVWIAPYVDAFREVGKYLNGGVAWTVPSLGDFVSSNEGNQLLPSWLQDSHMNDTNTIDGDKWRKLWADFYAARTSVLTALTDQAQQTADGAHDRIDDIVSDGIISAGSEKQLLYLDWLKAKQEYLKYMEQAEDYFGLNNTEDDNLVTAYTNLAKMLNNGVAPTTDILKGTARPTWLSLSNMNVDTVLSDTPTNNAETYRNTWNDYYVAVSSLLESITGKAKELADAAQEVADNAIKSIEAIANDNKIEKSELPEIRHNFLTMLHEFWDEGGLLDQARNESFNFISQDVSEACQDTEDAMKGIGTFLNGGEVWTYVKSQKTVNGVNVWYLNWISTMANLPIWLKSTYEYTEPIDIDGNAFVELWGTYYKCRAAILGILAEEAHKAADIADQKAQDALDDIDTITADSVLSRLEKKEVRKEWDEVTRSYTRNIALAALFDVDNSDYATDSDGNGIVSQYSLAYAKLGQYLSGCTNPESTSSWTSWTVGKIPVWLAYSGESGYVEGKGMGVDTDIVPANYRKYWVGLYDAENALLNAFSSIAKKAGDDALAKLEEIADDGVITPSEKNVLLLNWLEVAKEYPLLIQQGTTAYNNAKDNTLKSNINTAISAYAGKFQSLANYLNNGQYEYGSNSLPLPSMLNDTNIGTSEELTTSQKAAFKTVWSDYYKARTDLQNLIADASREPGDIAVDCLDNLADDGVLTEFEKLTVLREWDAITNEKEDLIEKARMAHVSSDTYVLRYNILGNYLNDPVSSNGKDIITKFSGIPAALITGGNTTINGTQFKKNWSNFYAARTALMSAISTSKVSYFVGTSVPSAPYYVGDLWLKIPSESSGQLTGTLAESGDMKVCIVECTTSGQETEQDWANLKEITEKRDPRILLVAVAEQAYYYHGGYIEQSPYYITVHMKTSTPSGTAGDLWYNQTSVYQYADGWEEISNESLLKAFNGLYAVLGEYSLRIYKNQVSNANQYDLSTSRVSFIDPFSQSGVEGSVQIMAYIDKKWEMLQESTRGLIQNLGKKLRFVVFGSNDDGTIGSSGILTQRNITQMFAQASDTEGKIITAAYIRANIVNSNGKLVSGVTVSADQIELTGTDKISLLVKNSMSNAVGPNMISNSLIGETSTAYGFAQRSVRLESGQKYTLSANGIVPYAAYQNNMELRVFIWRYADQTDVNSNSSYTLGQSWAQSASLAIEYNSGEAQTKSVTIETNRSCEYYICAYMYYKSGSTNGGTRTQPVTLNWIKLEKGQLATEWVPGTNDEMLWKNYIKNPRAVDGKFDDAGSCSTVTDQTFGEVVAINHSENSKWQLKFDAGNGYEDLVGKTVTFYVICKSMSSPGYEPTTGDNRKQLNFGGGDENVSVVNTRVSPFVDLGNGWRKYYGTKTIKTGLMSNNSGVDSGIIGINCVMGSWRVYAVGVVLGAVCPTTQEIMNQSGLIATGIDITNRTIELRADKVKFTSADGSISDKISIDPTTGTLYAKGGVFDGYIKSTIVQISSQNTTTVSITNPSNMTAYKLKNELNLRVDSIAEHPMEGAAVILPNAAKYIGSRVVLWNGCTPPYTRTAGSIRYSEILCEDLSPIRGLSGFVTDTNITGWNDPSRISWLNGIVELVGVPVDYYNNDTLETKCCWCIISFSSVSALYQVYNSSSNTWGDQTYL